MFKENFIKLCNTKGESPSSVCRKVGIAPATFSGWDSNSIPRKATLMKIAEYFGVTEEELTGAPKEGDMRFWNTFEGMCNAKQTTPADVSLKLNIPLPTIYGWKRGHVPKWGYLLKIAEYFDVSLAFLVGREEQEEKPDEPEQQLAPMNTQNIHMIPLFENVSAGFGVLAIDNVIDYIPLYISTKAEAEETICIKVRGDSMFPKIEDGDIIQVHKQSSVDSGTLAVVLLDGEEGLVKKVVYGETWIELHSVNPMYKTMRFNGAEVLRVKVLGEVKLIMKKP